MSGGLRLDDLTKLGNCAVCGKKQLEGPLPFLFLVVEISRAGFDLPAVKRAAGLEMQIGGPLASVLGPDEALARVVEGPHRVFVHETCAYDELCLFNLLPEDGK